MKKTQKCSTNASANVWNYRDQISNPTEQIINAAFNIGNIIGILQHLINTGVLDGNARVCYAFDAYTMQEMVTSLKKSTGKIANGTSKLRELLCHIDSIDPNRDVKLADIEKTINSLMNK
jgi:hypothetical protein